MKLISRKSEYDRKIKQVDDNIGEPPKAPPPRKRFILSDATVESRCAVHAENPRGFLFYKDEWTAHITSRAMYKSGKGDKREAELTEFNGGSLSKDRATNKQSTYIERTTISRTGSTQPETLRSYMGDHEDPTGEFARWLFCRADCPPAYIDLFSASDDNGVDQSLQSLYKNLGLLPNKDYFLSDEAKAVFQEYQHKIINWTLEEKHPGLKTAYAKFESYFARFALWLHCVNAALAGTIPEQSISKETMIKAAAMTSYLIGQLRIIYALNAPHVSLTGRLLKIKEYINNKPKGVTSRQIKSGLWFVREVPTADIAQDCKTLESSSCICLQDGRYYPAEGVDKSLSHPQHPYSTKSKAFAKSVDEVDTLLMNPQQHQPTIYQGFRHFVEGVDELPASNHLSSKQLPEEGVLGISIKKPQYINKTSEHIDSATVEPVDDSPTDSTSSTETAAIKFRLGDIVAHTDLYTEAYNYHGTVEAVDAEKALVRWAERKGNPNVNVCESYSVDELRRL